MADVRRADNATRGQSDFHATGCIILQDGDILLLRRQPDKSHPLLWGLPGGKVNSDESSLQAACREVTEETGLDVDASGLSHLADFQVSESGGAFTYSVFSYELHGKRPVVETSPEEHFYHAWVPINEALNLNLVPGTAECLLMVQDRIPIDSQLTLFELDEHPLLDRLGTTESAVRRQVAPRPVASKVADLIVVIGPPGSGKTTLVKNVIQQHPNWSIANRRFGQDRTSRQFRYLTQYLQGDPRWAFSCQIESLGNRYWQAFDGADSTTISDEWIYSSLAYSRTLRMQEDLTEDEYQTFYFIYLALARSIPAPALTIHLTANSDTLRRRILSRGRKLERLSHTAPYLERLRKSFHSVASEVSIAGGGVATIDTSDLSGEEVGELVDQAVTTHGIS